MTPDDLKQQPFKHLYPKGVRKTPRGGTQPPKDERDMETAASGTGGGNPKSGKKAYPMRVKA